MTQLSRESVGGARFSSRGSGETISAGRAIGRLLESGDLLLLRGTLGAGKTTLAQGLAIGLGIDDYVTSPTFTLVNEYRPADPSGFPLYHLDLYRTAGSLEALDLGLDEYLESGGVVAVEWAERAEDALPVEYLSLELAVDAVPDDGLVSSPGAGASSDVHARSKMGTDVLRTVGASATSPLGDEPSADERRVLVITAAGGRYFRRLPRIRAALVAAGLAIVTDEPVNR